MTLLVLFFWEHSGASMIAMHMLCGGLLVGRMLHAYGVAQVSENYRWRVMGMVLTFAAVVGAAFRLLLGAVWV